MSKAVRFLVPLISIALAVGGSELFLRWGGWGAPPVELHAQLLQHDPHLGWKKQPSARATYRWQGQAVVETSNSRGARGPEQTTNAAPVLFLGDSFCEGYLVSDDEVFSAVLDTERADLQTINHGVAGYSTDQALLLFRELSAHYSPSSTVLLFFDNDVWFNAQSNEYRSAKPRFTLDQGQLVLSDVPIRTPDSSVAASPSAGRSQDWRLMRLLRDALQRLEPSDAGGPLEPVNEFLVYGRSPTTEITAAWEITTALLNELNREATDAGSDFAVFYVPTVAAVDDAVWEQTRDRYAMAETEWDIHQVERDLAAVCERLGITLISPTERFRQQTAAGKTLYYLQDGHWNPQGHAAAAQILSELLSVQ